jgi:predicted esterase
MIVERSISTSLHGRYLLEVPEGSGPFRVLVAFHGYAEGASIQLDRMRAMPGSDRWLVASVQGLHRFYRRRTREVVASWMTQQDRELMIADNVAYVSAVIGAISREWQQARPLVFAGFSQGVAMAFRAACLTRWPVSGLIALGGDIPPELDRGPLGRVPCVLLGRGEQDEWYTHDKCEADQLRLRAAGVRVEVHTFAGGHEWTAEFSRAAADFLAGLA